MRLQERLKELSIKTGEKQYLLAEKCGFNSRDFNMMLNHRKPIYADDIPKICKGLGISVNELYEGVSG